MVMPYFDPRWLQQTAVANNYSARVNAQPTALDLDAALAGRGGSMSPAVAQNYSATHNAVELPVLASAMAQQQMPITPETQARLQAAATPLVDPNSIPPPQGAVSGNLSARQNAQSLALFDDPNSPYYVPR
jgi:hypothetical protein